MLASIRSNSRGFTVAELNVALVLLSLVIIALGGAFVNYLAVITRNNLSVKMTTNSQVLLRTVSEEVRYGAGIRQSNTIDDPSISGGAPEWNTSNTSFVIITAVPAVDSSGNYILDANQDPYLNELVYYKQGDLLLKRILAHPDAGIDNTLKTSCPPPSATPLCPADRTLAENFNSMVFTLYDQDNNTTTIATAARSVKIDLTLSQDTFGNPITITNTTRTTLRNTL